MSNKLTNIARDILAIESDLPFRFDYTKQIRPTIDDFEILVFEQIWGSTALGFNEMGGQAITSAPTYVFIPISCDQKCFVYFAGRFAYSADYSSTFQADVLAHSMESVSRSTKYVK